MKHDPAVRLIAPVSRDGMPSPRTQLRKILEESPEARPRVVQAVAALIGTALIALAALSALLIWHIMRRGRLVRERLGAPRVVHLPDLPEKSDEPLVSPPSSLSREIDAP
jgi:hypothetical protein